MNAIIVTRHSALSEYINERGIVPPGTPTIEHAHQSDVQGKHVFGVLPLRLAALAGAVTEIPLRLDVCDRGKEIGIERLREIALPPITYHVQRL